MAGKVGDEVLVKTKEESFEGVIMPEKNDKLVLKLKSGYNISIDKNDIKDITVISKQEKERKQKKLQSINPNLPSILILHTGGTIASKVDYRTGGVVSKFEPEDLLDMFPELKDVANFDSELVSNMWSDDLRFCHIEKIANEIEAESKKGYKGIIVGMGTDNLAVASAALAFAFEEINIPVILVGAQRSSDRGSSDAAINLICAAEFIAKTNFQGIAICMHSDTNDKECNILPACKTKKFHSSRRDAFKAVNDSIIAKVSYETRKVDFIKKDMKKGNSIIIKPTFEEKVGLLKIHINMLPEEFKSYSKFKGLVIEGTGLGHTPLDVIDSCTKVHKKIKNAIKKLTENGVVIVMTTNCIFGRVNMNVYSKGRDLQELGVISGEDMLAETALVKLSWLLANHPDKAKELMAKNLRGEITEETNINSHM
jgi:glutamyl-tRNA(Gln) amidotransferase subunit D